MARDINAYIRELLFGHDCVIVPGFGAFIGNFTPARIDREEGMFYPPAKKITFNRHLTTNDGLLIGHLSVRKGLSYGEAREIVTEYADVLRRRISVREQVSLEHIGTFSTNREGTIIFEPDMDANYLLTSYGLDSYHRRPVADFDIRKRVLELPEKPSVRQPSVKRLLTRAAVIIPLLVTMALVPFNNKIFKGKVAESTLNPLATAELEFNRAQINGEAGAAKIDSEVTVSSEANVDPAVIEPVVKEEPETVFIPAQPAFRYMLITGSFQTESNALTMVEKLRSKGYNPEVAAGPGGFLRVSAVTFESFAEAKTALASLNTVFPETWICKSR
ncbi:MAG TPA: SPOR domain-containing protein [Bacteroidales bacterium]|nr:SPOR domain-containing protein [Bacteroidales bacterium]